METDPFPENLQRPTVHVHTQVRAPLQYTAGVFNVVVDHRAHVFTDDELVQPQDKNTIVISAAIDDLNKSRTNAILHLVNEVYA